MKNISTNYVGVDVSKNKLDIFVYPLGKHIAINNSKVAISKFIAELANIDIKQIACEATGGYEKLFVQLLQEYYDVWVIDPRRVKGFIVSTGCNAKTDKIDAKKIAEFASKNTKKYETTVKTKNQEIVQNLVNRKHDLTTYLGAEKTRLKHPAHDFNTSNIKKCIKFFEKEIKTIEKLIQKLITQDKELSMKSKILESIPGIGQASAAVLLSFVPELGMLNNKQASALIGVCPYNRESGKYKGKKYIRGGRAIPRKVLYMCALTTIKYNLILKNFYNRLIDKQKPFKVAIVAVMHKLVVIANTLLKRGELCKV